jgi:hypothetical protein
MMSSTSDKIRLLKEKKAAETASTAVGKPEKPTPTTTKEEPVKEECPFCGNSFADLNKHVKKCKDNPDATKSITTKQPPTAPAFDVTAFFDEFKKYVVTPEQLMTVLKEESDRAKADRDKLDEFIRVRPEPTESSETMLTVVKALKDEVSVLIDAVARSWNELEEPAKQHWKVSTGYLKIIDRLEHDISALKTFITNW